MSLAETIDDDRIGHNKPPSEFETLKSEVEVFLATADKWLTERPVFTDAEMARKSEDFDTQLRALEKRIGSVEETEKRPLMNALDEIRSRFKSLGGRVSEIRALFKRRREAWLIAEDRRIAEERRQREAEARRAQEEADRLRQQAEETAAAAEAGELKGSGVSVVNALDDARQAEETAAVAQANLDASMNAKAQVRGDMTGRASSLKTFYTGKIVDNGKLLAWVKKNRSEDLMTFLQKYADTYARSPELRKTGLPGVEFIEGKRL